MRKFAVLLILTQIISFTLLGCTNKEEELKRQQEESAKNLQLQIDNMKQEATDFAAKGDFDNTIALYEKILNLKEDSEIRNNLADIKIEKESVEKTKVFLSTVKDMQYKLDTISNMVDLSKLLIENKKVFDEFENLDTTKNSQISNFVKDILNSNHYKNFKDYYDNDYIKQAELNSKNNKTLDKLSGDITFSLMDNLLYESMKNNIKLYLGMFPKELPAKYK
jgi:hypothetical protein